MGPKPQKKSPTRSKSPKVKTDNVDASATHGLLNDVN